MDVYPTGTLNSGSGTHNEQKNTQNNVIEVEIRKLSKQVYILSPHEKPL